MAIGKFLYLSLVSYVGIPGLQMLTGRSLYGPLVSSVDRSGFWNKRSGSGCLSQNMRWPRSLSKPLFEIEKITLSALAFGTAMPRKNLTRKLH
jgi:hypothetical protein